MAQVTIDHPTGRENFTEVTIGDLTLWFSYKTIVGYRINGERVVRQNEWGPTTGKHLNHIDGGQKDIRPDGETFERLLAAVVSAVEVATGTTVTPL